MRVSLPSQSLGEGTDKSQTTNHSSQTLQHQLTN